MMKLGEEIVGMRRRRRRRERARNERSKFARIERVIRREVQILSVIVTHHPHDL